MIGKLSNQLLKIEILLLKILMAGLLGLILLNVVTRSMSNAIYWVDEAAIYCMIWLVFMGASVALRLRETIAVTLFTDVAPPKVRLAITIFLDLLTLCLNLLMIWFCWNWYQPLDLANLGFDTDLFSQESFNFIYQEPTNTIGLPKFWIWLIVPVFAVTSSIHALANLLDSVNNRGTIAHETSKDMVD